MRKAEYDFLTWTSFPSSLKLLSDEERVAAWNGLRDVVIPFTPGAELRVEVQAKQQGVVTPTSRIYVYYYPFDGEWHYMGDIELPTGTFNWSTFGLTRLSTRARENATHIRLEAFYGGSSGIQGRPAVTWYDNLEIYQDDTLIYANDFSNWNPHIGSGIGALAGGIGSYAATKNPLAGVIVASLTALIGGSIGMATARPKTVIGKGYATAPCPECGSEYLIYNPIHGKRSPCEVCGAELELVRA